MSVLQAMMEVCEIVQHDILRERISERTRKHGVDRFVHHTFEEMDIPQERTPKRIGKKTVEVPVPHHKGDF